MQTHSETARSGPVPRSAADRASPSSAAAQRVALVPRPAASGGVIQRLPADVTAKLDQAGARDPNLGGATLIVTTISDRLSHNRIPHRLGGSLAAKLHGAGRMPHDVDVEVQRRQDVRGAYDTLRQSNGTVTFRGARVPVRAAGIRFTDGLSAGVRVEFARPGGQPPAGVDVDITNENNPAFNAGLRSPAERGAHARDGNLVSAPELLINYLDRTIQKPATALAKNDHHQIVHLLLAAGFNPRNPTHIGGLRNVIAGLAKPAALNTYLNRLSEIIRAAMHAGLFR